MGRGEVGGFRKIKKASRVWAHNSKAECTHSKCFLGPSVLFFPLLFILSVGIAAFVGPHTSSSSSYVRYCFFLDIVDSRLQVRTLVHIFNRHFFLWLQFFDLRYILVCCCGCSVKVPSYCPLSTGFLKVFNYFVIRLQQTWNGKGKIYIFFDLKGYTLKWSWEVVDTFLWCCSI